MEDDHRYEKALRGYGYLRVKVSAKELKCEFFQVDEHNGKKKLFDTVSVDLATSKLK